MVVRALIAVEGEIAKAFEFQVRERVGGGSISRGHEGEDLDLACDFRLVGEELDLLQLDDVRELHHQGLRERAESSTLPATAAGLAER